MSALDVQSMPPVRAVKARLVRLSSRTEEARIRTSMPVASDIGETIQDEGMHVNRRHHDAIMDLASCMILVRH